MKCICKTSGKGLVRSIQQREEGVVKRVKDTKAITLVNSGRWEYCPKWLWKEKGRKYA